MKSPVERFYDRFSRTFVRDYVLGNRRVERQIAFFRSALPASTRSILVIGCGSGESAIALATAFDAAIVAVDISAENLRLARALHAHPRITYEQRDVLARRFETAFDAILLPDVYEHIPVAARGALHATLRESLAERGRILLTIPSPGKQASLEASQLQIIDEVVTLDDVARLAGDVLGTVAYFNLISVWEANDYVHAMIVRGGEQVAPISDDAKLAVSGWGANRLARAVEAGPLRAAVRGARAVRRVFRLRHLLRTPR